MERKLLEEAREARRKEREQLISEVIPLPLLGCISSSNCVAFAGMWLHFVLRLSSVLFCSVFRADPLVRFWEFSDVLIAHKCSSFSDAFSILAHVRCTERMIHGFGKQH